MEKKYVNNPEKILFNNVEYKVVNDYDEALECLNKGELVMHYEAGDSMYPILCNMEYGLMIPATKAEKGDAVFCRLPVSAEMKAYGWDGLMTHRVIDKVKIHGEDPYYLIGSTSGDIYGWTQEIHAKVLSTRVFQTL